MMIRNWDVFKLDQGGLKLNDENTALFFFSDMMPSSEKCFKYTHILD